MTTPRISLACLWGVLAFLALVNGTVLGTAVAWWLLAALVPPLVVFVWWMVDRAALEHRIRRLEARSEIGDERQIAAHADLTNVRQRLHRIEAGVALAQTEKSGALGPGA